MTQKRKREDKSTKIPRFCGMIEMIGDFYPEGIGSEVFVLGLGILVLSVTYLAWLSTGFPPLSYEVFLVEMQTWNNHRFVQVLHVGLEDVRQFSGDLVRRIRAAGSRFRPSGNEMIPRAISDINIVIQSPGTIIEGQAIEPVPNGEMRLYQVQMPLNTPNQSNQNSERRNVNFTDSELAALATLAVVTGRMGSSLGGRGSQSTVIGSEEVLQREGDRVGNATLLGEGPLPQESIQSSSIQETSIQSVSEGSEDVERIEERMEEVSEEKTSIERPGTALKLKFLDDSHIIAITAFNRTVGDFKREFFASALAEGKVVRLIYKGQLLRDDSRSLASYGVEDQCVVHCHVSNTPYQKTFTQSNRPRHASASIPSGDEGLPSVPISTDPPPRAGSNRFMEIINRFASDFPLSAFQTETMAAAVQGFFEDPIAPNNTPNANENRGFFANISQRFQNATNAFENRVYEDEEEAMEFASDQAANPSGFRIEIGDLVLWIFGVQLAAVWIFWWMYPQFCDNSAFYLLIFFTIYFAFIVCRHHISPQNT